jgi:hypothetical protein
MHIPCYVFLKASDVIIFKWENSSHIFFFFVLGGVLSVVSVFVCCCFCVFPNCQAAIERHDGEAMFFCGGTLIKASPPMSFCFTTHIFLCCRALLWIPAWYPVNELCVMNSCAMFCHRWMAILPLNCLLCLKDLWRITVSVMFVIFTPTVRPSAVNETYRVSTLNRSCFIVFSGSNE